MKFLALVLAALVATTATISVDGVNSPVHRQLPPGENGYQPSDGGRLNSTAAANGSNSSEYGNRNKSGYSHGSRGEYGGRKNETVTQVPATTNAAPASGASTAMAVGTAAAFIAAVAAVF